MSYRVELSRAARKTLDNYPDKLAARITARVLQLADNPRPHDCKKLHEEEAYRIRVGDYRIVYEIHDRVLLIIVVAVGHRRDIYR